MTIQEEVRKGVIAFIKICATKPDIYTPEMCTDDMLECLHSQGVVIKVDGKLPQVIKRTTRLMGATFPEDDPWKGDEHLEPCPLCSQVGFEAVEPLKEA